ncbi:MAG: hypothetical protein CYG61_00225 [Actinobacteria bacterium]|nr:MAG: hypothetical protein CYG61_00225 [Actinomycetota bacterium]
MGSDTGAAGVFVVVADGVISKGAGAWPATAPASLWPTATTMYMPGAWSGTRMEIEKFFSRAVATPPTLRPSSSSQCRSTVPPANCLPVTVT